MIDLHCHILPGVDDGARTLEDALEMARVAEKEGIVTIVATPHLFRDNFDYGSFDGLEAKRREASRALRENGIAVELLPGAEVHIFHDLMGAVRRSRESLVINRSSYIFVEFPANHVFSGAKNLLFELMSENLTPIIAHPERNAVFIQNPTLLYEFVCMGALAQANSGSFLGLYGERTEKAVFQFLELNLIHFIGSDSHSARSLSWRFGEALGKVEKKPGGERARALVEENPRAVVENREVPVVLPPTNPKEKEKSFSIKLPRFARGNKDRKSRRKA